MEIGTITQFSKRDADRNDFLFKVRQMKVEIWDLVFKQIKVNLYIFDYASRLCIQIDENIFKANNIIIINAINVLLEEVEILIKKVEFSGSLRVERRDKITDILFEAKTKIKELQEDSKAENKLLDKIIQAENKQGFSTEQMKQKILRKVNQKNISIRPIIALVLGIFLGWAGADRFYKGDICLVYLSSLVLVVLDFCGYLICL